MVLFSDRLGYFPGGLQPFRENHPVAGPETKRLPVRRRDRSPAGQYMASFRLVIVIRKLRGFFAPLWPRFSLLDLIGSWFTYGNNHIFLTNRCGLKAAPVEYITPAQRG